MHILSGAAEKLPARLYADIARYRHTVFVEQLGWALQARNGMEQDQFDRHDTLYVVAQNGEGRIYGCARLLPTTRPYLLSEVFPQLLNGPPTPRSKDVWELSRFAAVDISTKQTPESGQFSSPIAVELLHESIACVAERGAKRLITVSPIGIERLLRRAGFYAYRAGPPMVIDGHPIFACWIEIDQ
jgi:N-acyl-L-homoserine lactone synthetase